VSGIPRARLAAILRGAADSDLPEPSAVAGIRVPTLILAWSGDRGHPLNTAERLHELIADSDLRVAETSEDLDGWPSLVRSFLGRL